MCSARQSRNIIEDDEHIHAYLLQEHDNVGVVGGDSELHGDLQQGSHHGDVGVVGRGQRHSQVLADLPGTLEEYLVELLVGNELWGEEGGREGDEMEKGRHYISWVQNTVGPLINALSKNCVSVFYRYIHCNFKLQMHSYACRVGYK